jgi:hypothetical protein
MQEKERRRRHKVKTNTKQNIDVAKFASQCISSRMNFVSFNLIFRSTAQNGTAPARSIIGRMLSSMCFSPWAVAVTVFFESHPTWHRSGTKS